MIPAVYNLNLYKGDTGRWQFKLWTDSAKTQPADLTDVVVDATLRDKPTGGVYRAALDCTVTVPNIIDMVLSATLSRDLPVKGVWDLQLTYPSGDIVTPLNGTVTVTQDITYVDPGKRLMAVR